MKLILPIYLRTLDATHSKCRRYKS